MKQQQERRVERSFVPERVEGAIHALREEKKQAERACHDKSLFLALASHDLRQPIHALGLYVAELRRKISGNEEQEHLIGQVERSVDAISTLVTSLLDISRLDAGVVVPQKQACDVSELLERIVANFQILAQAKNIRLTVRPFCGFVDSDPSLLERIVMNLLSNALRYTQPNGTVMVACRRRGCDLLIEVRDNGIGIDPAYHENIFCEYVQLEQSQLDAQKGLGLGLAIVDRLARLLDHRISLRSAPGMGSTFALRLNLVANQPASITDLSDADGSLLAGKKLLVVDRDTCVRNGTAALLGSWGCDVTAVDSIKAVQKRLMEGACWDMVISEFQIGGGITGLDVIQMVHQYQDCTTPCVLISADTRLGALDLTAHASHSFLHKPVRPAKLRSLMQFLLAESKAAG